jgi:hypothetical protein
LEVVYGPIGGGLAGKVGDGVDVRMGIEKVG